MNNAYQNNQPQNSQNNLPRMLPITRIDGKSYFVDERLKQYRNVDNPHDFIDFNDMPGVFSYTRAQALEDGVLIDVSSLAKEAGFKFPVAVTSGIYELLNDTEQPGQSFEGRAWDMLIVLRYEIKKASDCDIVYFAPLFNAHDHEKPRAYKMYSKCHPGDNFEPVITIMLPHED